MLFSQNVVTLLIKHYSRYQLIKLRLSLLGLLFPSAELNNLKGQNGISLAWKTDLLREKSSLCRTLAYERDRRVPASSLAVTRA